MKKSQLRKLIRESIKELITEQAYGQLSSYHGYDPDLFARVETSICGPSELIQWIQSQQYGSQIINKTWNNLTIVDSNGVQKRPEYGDQFYWYMNFGPAFSSVQTFYKVTSYPNRANTSANKHAFPMQKCPFDLNVVGTGTTGLLGRGINPTSNPTSNLSSNPNKIIKK
tara:strand:- start:50 stop:556 length:507 start_codon:yes stop_codon:yes gene_type:complete